MFLRVLFLTVWMISIGICQADESMMVKYAGYDFSIPANPSVVATSGDNTRVGILIFKYDGLEKNGYITFMNMNNDPTLEETLDVRWCDFATFIEDLILRNHDTTCNPEVLDAFYADLTDSDYGFWPGRDGNQLLYMIDTEGYYIYIKGPDGQLIQVATDMFGSTEALKSVVMPIAQ